MDPATLTHTQPPTGAGTTIRSRDTLAARTSFRFVRCAAISQRRTHVSLVGSFTHHDRAGSNRVQFTRRLDGHPPAAGTFSARFSIPPPPTTLQEP
jgi:hypothetical protein